MPKSKEGKSVRNRAKLKNIYNIENGFIRHHTNTSMESTEYRNFQQMIEYGINIMVHSASFKRERDSRLCFRSENKISRFEIKCFNNNKNITKNLLNKHYKIFDCPVLLEYNLW